MNTLASLPTDILYKFAAIIGILFAITVPIFIKQLKSKIFTNLLEVSRELHDLRCKEIELNKRKLKVYALNNNEKKAEIEAIVNEYTMIEERIESIKNSKHDLERDYDFLKGNIKIVVIILLGFSVSGYGFYFWYHKNQKLNDEFLKLKLIELRVKVGESVDHSCINAN